MALHFSDTKSFSRKDGKSAIASIAYRSGEKLFDERQNKTHNYTAKSKSGGVVDKKMLLPSKFSDQNITLDRATEWNKAEKAEKRKDARVAREWLINIPYELYEKDPQKAIETAFSFGQKLSDRYNCLVDCCIHKPTEKDIANGADPRNIHCHIMLTTREVEIENGEIKFTKKTVAELSDTDRRKLGLCRMSEEIPQVKQLWDNTANPVLSAYDIEPMDWRSNKEKAKETGVDIMPQVKMGVAATAMERKGITTVKGDINRLIGERNELLFKRHLEHEIIIESRKQPEPQQATPEPIIAPVKVLKSDKGNEPQLTPSSRPQTAQEYLDSLNAQLGKPVAPVEQPQTPPKPQPERDPHALIQEYDKKRHSLAERFFKTELKALATKLNGLVQKYKDLQASKPRFFGKDKWQDDVTATKTEHTATKATYDTVKNGGITITHFQKATDYLTKHEQDFCNQVDQARQSLIDQARQRELERQQAKATQTHPEPSVERLVRSDRVIEQPEPTIEPQSQTPPERLEMVSIDPRLRYETRKGLEQIKAHIEAMPSGERQNLAISEFNKVVVEQLEQQQSQKQSPER